jgi:hypothetical protein
LPEDIGRNRCSEADEAWWGDRKVGLFSLQNSHAVILLSPLLQAGGLLRAKTQRIKQF